MSQRAELELMQKIKGELGILIASYVRGTPVPGAFLAALIAGESGGASYSRRFEPSVFNKLKDVRSGKLDHYGQIHKKHIVAYDDDGLELAACSLGLTQIMGYHIILDGLKPLALYGSETNLKKAVKMLSWAVRVYKLDPTTDEGAGSLFRWWNTGAVRDNPATPRIEGKTCDPNYVSNGLMRIAIYRELK